MSSPPPHAISDSDTSNSEEEEELKALIFEGGAVSDDDDDRDFVKGRPKPEWSSEDTDADSSKCNLAEPKGMYYSTFTQSYHSTNNPFLTSNLSLVLTLLILIVATTLLLLPAEIYTLLYNQSQSHVNLGSLTLPDLSVILSKCVFLPLVVIISYKHARPLLPQALDKLGIIPSSFDFKSRFKTFLKRHVFPHLYSFLSSLSTNMLGAHANIFGVTAGTSIHGRLLTINEAFYSSPTVINIPAMITLSTLYILPPGMVTEIERAKILEAMPIEVRDLLLTERGSVEDVIFGALFNDSGQNAIYAGNGDLSWDFGEADNEREREGSASDHLHTGPSAAAKGVSNLSSVLYRIAKTRVSSFLESNVLPKLRHLPLKTTALVSSSALAYQVVKDKKSRQLVQDVGKVVLAVGRLGLMVGCFGGICGSVGLLAFKNGIEGTKDEDRRRMGGSETKKSENFPSAIVNVKNSLVQKLPPVKATRNVFFMVFAFWIVKVKYRSKRSGKLDGQSVLKELISLSKDGTGRKCVFGGVFVGCVLGIVGFLKERRRKRREGERYG